MTDKDGDPGVALIAGVTGISGSQLAKELTSRGWEVHGISRNAPIDLPDVHHVGVNLLDAEATREALRARPITHAFFNTWSRQPTEDENIVVNGTLLRNMIQGIDPSANLLHVALVTGLKHYFGPYEVNHMYTPPSPFKESQPRLSYPNFYYEQEDILFAEADRRGFNWVVHRPHTLIGWALGNLMNMGVTLALYGAICRATGRPFSFPGSEAKWNGLLDVTDSRMLAKQMHWAATTPAAANEAFNIVNGDVFRWNQLWYVLAEDLGVEATPWTPQSKPLAVQMAEAAETWPAVVHQENLQSIDIESVASWWHTDADLGRPYEAVTDMSKSRRNGFREFQTTDDSFLDLFETLREARIIPRWR